MAPADNDDTLLAQADQHWLAVGLRMGLERPEDARRLLARIERPWEAGSAAEAPGDVDPGDVAPGAPGEGDGVDRPAPTGDHDVPASSMLLVRSATMAAAQQAEVGPEVVWGWVARLAPADITLIGRVVQQMIDEGAPANAARGFGIAWTDGVKLPVAALDLMFKEFVELEHTVASVLAGREIRPATKASEAKSISGTLAGWFGRRDPVAAEAGSVIEGGGKPAQLGLVALWNVWVAVRYRASIPQRTFDLLVKPWTTVVGPLPDA